MSSETRIFSVNRRDFVVPSTYTPVDAAGFGAFGDELRVHVADSSAGEAVSGTAADKSASAGVKKPRPIFIIRKVSAAYDDPIALRILARTLKLQAALPATLAGVVPVVDAYIPASTPDDVYIVVPEPKCTLADAISARTALDHDQIMAISYSLALTLRELHASGIVLCGLYPEAVSVDTTLSRRDSVAINTLSFARGASEALTEQGAAASPKAAADSAAPADRRVLSVPLAYRAPEWALEGVSYLTPAADMFSLGLLICEMLLQRPLISGSSAREYADSVTNLLGARDNFGFYTNGRTARLLKSFGSKQPVSLSVVLHGCDRRLLLLLQRMLVYDPAKRISADELLKSPLFAAWTPGGQLPATTKIAPDWMLPQGTDKETLIEAIQQVVQLV